MIYFYPTESLKQKSDIVLLFSQNIRTVCENGGSRSLNDTSKPHYHFSWLLGSHLLECVCMCMVWEWGGSRGGMKIATSLARMLSSK